MENNPILTQKHQLFMKTCLVDALHTIKGETSTTYHGIISWTIFCINAREFPQQPPLQTISTKLYTRWRLCSQNVPGWSFHDFHTNARISLRSYIYGQSLPAVRNSLTNMHLIICVICII